MNKKTYWLALALLLGSSRWQHAAAVEVPLALATSPTHPPLLMRPVAQGTAPAALTPRVVT